MSEPEAPPIGASASPRARRGSAAALRRPLAIVLGAALWGSLAGVVWWAVWTPPTGVAIGGTWLLDTAGARTAASGTALYVVVAVLAGLLLGAVVGVTGRGAELQALVCVALGSALAGLLMAATGAALGPPDPRPLAADAPDRTRLDGDLRVLGESPYLALPAGALAALSVVFLATGSSRERASAMEPER